MENKIDEMIEEPPTVGEVIKDYFLETYDITQQKLADALGVSRNTVNQIVNNKRKIRISEAALLSILFDVNFDFWINIQAEHDRWQVMKYKQKIKSRLISKLV